jgi:hypothetical protein
VWVGRVGAHVAQADQQKEGPGTPKRRPGPSVLKTEAAVSGGRDGGSAWDLPKTYRGPLLRMARAVGRALTVAGARSGLLGMRSRWDGQRNDHREYGENTLHGLSLSPLVDGSLRLTAPATRALP